MRKKHVEHWLLRREEAGHKYVEWDNQDKLYPQKSTTTKHKTKQKLNICVLNYLRFKFPVSFKPCSKKCWEKIDSNFKSNIKVKIVTFSCCYDQEVGIFCSFAIVCVQSCKVLHFQIVQFIIWWEIIDLAFRENRSNTIFERKVRCTREVKQK